MLFNIPIGIIEYNEDMQTAGGQFMDNKELIKKYSVEPFLLQEDMTQLGYEEISKQLQGLPNQTLYYYFGKQTGNVLENTATEWISAVRG